MAVQAAADHLHLPCAIIRGALQVPARHPPTVVQYTTCRAHCHQAVPKRLPLRLLPGQGREGTCETPLRNDFDVPQHRANAGGLYDCCMNI